MLRSSVSLLTGGTLALFCFSAVVPVHASSLRDRAAERRAERLAQPSRTALRAMQRRIRNAMLERINFERSEKNRAPLRMHPTLEISAQSTAARLAELNILSHIFTASTPTDRIREAGYFVTPCEACSWEYTVGENLARGYASVDTVMDAWMQSPEHRANILHPAFSVIGIGMVGSYWVQHFGGVAIVR